jgi:hypothetical protein
MLERLAERTLYQISGPAETSVPWKLAYPVPLVRAKLDGHLVLLAIDTGADDLLLNESAARRYKVERFPAQYVTFWSGSRTVVRGAFVKRLELGAVKIEGVPAAVLSLNRWSLDVNPQGQRIDGIIGLNLLRQFTATLDYQGQRLELRRGVGLPAGDRETHRIPFEVWGIAELMVKGSISGSRPMNLLVETGVPRCGVGAPSDVFDEVGVKPSSVAKLAKGAGAWLRGTPWAEVTVPAVVVGPVARDRLTGWLGALDASELWRHGVRRDALISHDFFRGTRLTIDWAARVLVIEE